MVRTAILGGGALGLTAALRLAQRGEDVVLFERQPEPGGLAAGFPLGPSYLEKFYHHLFRSDTAAVALIEEIGLGHRLVWPRPKTSTLVGGKRFQLDSPQSVLTFPPLSPVERARLAAVAAYLRLEPNYRRLEGTTADAWLRRWMGERVYDVVWRPLLQSKFGDHYRDISMSWFWARIHLRSSSLGYLRGGFQQLYDGLAEQIRTRGGEVQLGTQVDAVRTCDGGGFVVSTSGGEARVDRVISTLPTPLTCRLISELPDVYRERYANTEALGAHCLILALDRQLTDVYWLNVNDPGYPFLALVEHTNYMPPDDYGGRHLIYLGNYVPMDDPLMTMSQEQVLERFLPAVQRINPAFQREWVTETWMFRAPHAQPLVTVGYADRLPPHTTPIPHLYLANMSQVYPQDRGQNYSIAMANRLVEGLAPIAS